MVLHILGTFHISETVLSNQDFSRTMIHENIHKVGRKKYKKVSPLFLPQLPIEENNLAGGPYGLSSSTLPGEKRNISPAFEWVNLDY